MAVNAPPAFPWGRESLQSPTRRVEQGIESMVEAVNSALVIHGGAGVMADHDYSASAAFMAEILVRGGAALRTGAAALDLVVEMVAAMEESGLFIAGKGSSANRAGLVELDASVMTGHDRDAGAVAAVRRVVNPIRLARAVMAQTPHVMLAGSGADAFADAVGLARVADPNTYYRAATEITGAGVPVAEAGSIAHGTVGAVALDCVGQLAAATSTGGTLNKQPGRVGDTPLIGAGTWADDRVAVSGTGQGEFFIRVAAAREVAALMAYGGMDVESATRATIDAIAALGGNGGLIAVDRAGNIAMPFNSGGMKRGYVRLETEPVVAVT